MAQESRLVVVIDSKNSEKVAKALNEELVRLDKSGLQVSHTMKSTGDTIQAQTGKIDKFKQGITALAAESKIYFAGLAGSVVGSAGALVALAVQTANTAAEIEKLAYLSGSTTVEFQEWSAGAKAMGIEMDKLSDIFKDVQDRVGDFITTGGGELKDFFTEIAVKTEGSSKGAMELAKSMRELSGPQALQLYVNKLKEAGIAQSEMVFYMESVADEATALIPLLENGGEGFRLWAEAAHNAGAIMDDETLQAAQRLKVETQLLEMQMTGLRNQFMSGLLPALNQIGAAFNSTSEYSLNLKSAAEGVGNTLIWLTKVGMGVAATFDIVGKVVGGTIAAISDKSVTHQMVLDDIAKGVDEWGTKFNKLNDSASNNKLVDNLVKIQQRANDSAKATANTAINTSKMQEAFDKADGSAKKLKDNAAKLRREAERAAEEVRRIAYEYTSEEGQKAIDLQKEIARLQKYGQTQYIDIARNRYKEERKLAKMNFEYDLVEFSLSEEKKLRYSFNIREQQIIADNKLTKEQTKQKLEALKYEFSQELAYVKLAQEQRLYQSKLFLMSETEAMRERYRLEREEIAKTVMDAEERSKRLSLLQTQQQLEQITKTAQALKNWQSTYAEMTGNSQMFQLDQTRQDRTGQSLALADSQNADVMARAQDPNADMEALAAEQEEIWKAHKDRMLLIDQDYENSKAALGAGAAANTLSGMADLMGSLLGEQSAGYKAMFAMSKAFAIAQAIINAPKTFSDVYASVAAIPYVGPYLAPVMAGAAVATQMAQVAQIRSTNMQGFATGGYTGDMGRGDVAGVVHGQEYVLNAAATKRVGVDTLNAINSGGSVSGGESGGKTVVNINHDPSLAVTTRDDGMGNIDVYIQQAVAQSWNNLSKPSSRESKAMKRFTTARPTLG